MSAAAWRVQAIGGCWLLCGDEAVRCGSQPLVYVSVEAAEAAKATIAREAGDLLSAVWRVVAPYGCWLVSDAGEVFRTPGGSPLVFVSVEVARRELASGAEG